METIYQLSEFQKYRENLGNKSQIIGFVPTMGALHEGHLSLIEKAKESSKNVIVSIFVNPSQFNDPEDLKKYPRTIDKDLELLLPLAPDAVFIPEVKAIYPEQDKRKFEFGNLENVMEGKHRPGHFNGVAQVVSRLFDIVLPHKAYFGQKDFQQLAIVKSMVLQLNYPIEIISCPIIREENGLAMSSRNRLLTTSNRKKAALLYEVLQEAKIQYQFNSIEEISSSIRERFNNNTDLELEYFEIVDSENLTPANKMDSKSSAVACIAAKINGIRLIDNLIFA